MTQMQFSSKKHIPLLAGTTHEEFMALRLARISDEATRLDLGSDARCLSERGSVGENLIVSELCIGLLLHV